MFSQNYGGQIKPSDKVEEPNKDANGLVVNPDPFADKVPVDAALIHETPMGGTLAAVSPLNGPPAETIPMFETPFQEIPMGGTLAAVGPMYGPPTDEISMGGTVTADAPLNVPIVHETPTGETIPYTAPVAEPVTYKPPVVTNTELSTTLFTREESEHFRARWSEIQGQFVDEPHSAVQQADALISEVIEQITQKFTNEHSSLKGLWNQGNDASTEDLRKALQRYRSFFKRLVV
jgi:hypothetical protein